MVEPRGDLRPSRRGEQPSYGPGVGRATTVGIAGAAVAYAGLHWLGRTSGTTVAERRLAAPGDDLVESPLVVTDHAVTVDAPPGAVWPWLVQMGWGRAGWYTARWVDRAFFPANGPSADRIHEEWQDLAVGDRVLDGAPETRRQMLATLGRAAREGGLFYRIGPGLSE